MSTIKVNRIENTATTDGGIDIDSNGKIGIGTASPTFAAGGGIHNKGSNGAFTSFRASVDSNTGVDFAAANDGNGFIYNRDNANLSFGTNNTERLRITNDGKVGVGTAAPTRDLEVSKAGSAYIRAINTTNSVNIDVLAGTSAAFVGPQSNHPLAFQTNNTERMRIDSSGNIGIGTSSPSHGLLTLSQSASSAFNALVIQQGNTGSAATDGLHIGIDSAVDAYIMHKESRALAFGTANTERMRIDSSGNIKITFPDGNAGLRNKISFVTESPHQDETAYIAANRTAVSSAPTDLVFAAGTASGASERMRITSDGKFGFNTTNPGAFDSGANNFVVLGNTSGTGHAGITIASGTDSYGNIYFGDGTGAASYKGFIAYNHDGNTLRFGTDGTERMRIHSGGQVEFKNGSFANNVDCVMANGGTMEIGAQSTIKFRIATNEKLRLDSSGNLLIGTTSVGGSGGISLRSNGHFIAPVCYSVGLSASPRDAFIDSNGELGYVPSIRKAKTNIQVQSNVDWLYQLEPVTFNYKTKDRETGNYTDKAEAELEYGLIAEDVETACPDLCFYDQTDNGPELRGVSYKKLITPILKALQDAKAEIETLKTKVAALEAG